MTAIRLSPLAIRPREASVADFDRVRAVNRFDPDLQTTWRAVMPDGTLGPHRKTRERARDDWRAAQNDRTKEPK